MADPLDLLAESITRRQLEEGDPIAAAARRRAAAGLMRSQQTISPNPAPLGLPARAAEWLVGNPDKPPARRSSNGVTPTPTARPPATNGNGAAILPPKAQQWLAPDPTPKPSMDPATRERVATSSAELEAREAPEWSKLDEPGKLAALNARRAAYGLPPVAAVPGPETAGHALGEQFGTVKGIAQKIPFIGAGVEAVDLWDLYASAKRAETGKATDADWSRLAKFQEELTQAQRGVTVGGGAVNIAAESLPFMAEFLASGGILPVLKQAVKGGVKGAVKRAVSEGIKAAAEAGAKKAVKKGVGAAVGRAAKAAAGSAVRLPAFAPRIAADVARNMTPGYRITPADQKQMQYLVTEPGAPFWRAARDAVADTYIEIVSEQTGGALGRIAGATASKTAKALRIPAGRFKEFTARAKTRVAVELAKRFPKQYPNLATAAEFLRKAGYHGPLEEMGEERVGQLLRLAARETIEAVGGETTIEPGPAPDAKQIAQELAAFGAVGVGGGALALGVAGMTAKRPPKDGQAVGEVPAPAIPPKGPPIPPTGAQAPPDQGVIPATSPPVIPPSAGVSPAPPVRETFVVEPGDEAGKQWNVVAKPSGKIVQTVPDRVIAQLIADERNPPGPLDPPQATKSQAAPPGKPPTVREQERQRITDTEAFDQSKGVVREVADDTGELRPAPTVRVPKGPTWPAFTVTQLPNGVQLLRLRARAAPEIITRIKSQGARWIPKMGGWLMPHKDAKAIESLITGRRIKGATTLEPPMPPGITPAPTESGDGIRALTAADVAELSGMPEKDHKALVIATLTRRGWKHVTPSDLTKDDYLEHPQGWYRYVLRRDRITGEKLGYDGTWTAQEKAHPLTYKRYAASIRPKLRELAAQFERERGAQPSAPRETPSEAHPSAPRADIGATTEATPIPPSDEKTIEKQSAKGSETVGTAQGPESLSGAGATPPPAVGAAMHTVHEPNKRLTVIKSSPLPDGDHEVKLRAGKGVPDVWSRASMLQPWPETPKDAKKKSKDATIEEAAPTPPEPFTAQALTERFGLSDEQAAAAVQLAEEMDLPTERIKVAKGTETPPGTDPRILYQLEQDPDDVSPLGFYSQLRRALAGLRSENDRVTLAYLKKQGVKDDELDWAGLLEPLQAGETITKKAAIETVSANQTILIESQLRNFTLAERMRLHQLNQLIMRLSVGGIGEHDEARATMRDKRINRLIEARGRLEKSAPSPRFENWTEPGGERYRELLFRVEFGEAVTSYFVKDDLPHFGDFENVIAHARVKDRPTPGEAPTLFIEEIQSDWHQGLRGKNPTTRQEMREAEQVYEQAEADFKAADDRMNALRAQWEEPARRGEDVVSRAHPINKVYIESIAATRERNNAFDWFIRRGARLEIMQRGPLEAPFKNWHELAMKRLIFMAAKEGYGRIAWTTGLQQARRYNLAKHVSHIYWQTLTDAGEQEFGELRAYDTQANQILAESMLAEKVPTYIGKELAARLFAAEPQGRIRRIMLDKAEVIGAEGMTGFYDKILVNDVNKLIKRWGQKVAPVRIYPAFKREHPLDQVPYVPFDEPVHGFDITPEMRESVLKQGFALFQRSGGKKDRAKGAVEFTPEGDAIIRALNKPDVSTVIHELAHIGRRWLFDKSLPREQRAGITDKNIRDVEAWAGVQDGAWTAEAEEKFARAVERYLRDGKAPTAKLRELFEKIKTWMRKIYKSIAGGPLAEQIPNNVRWAIGNMLSRRSWRTNETVSIGERKFWSKDPSVEPPDIARPYLTENPAADLARYEKAASLNVRYRGKKQAIRTQARKIMRSYAEKDPVWVYLNKRVIDFNARRRVEGQPFAKEFRKARTEAAEQAPGLIKTFTMTPVHKLPSRMREAVRHEALVMRDTFQSIEGREYAGPMKGIAKIMAGAGADTGADVQDVKQRILDRAVHGKAYHEVQTRYGPPTPAPTLELFLTPELATRKRIIDEAIESAWIGEPNELADELRAQLTARKSEAGDPFPDVGADELVAEIQELAAQALTMPDRTLGDEGVHVTAQTAPVARWFDAEALAKAKLRPAWRHIESGQVWTQETGARHDPAVIDREFWTLTNDGASRPVRIDAMIEAGFTNARGDWLSREEAQLEALTERGIPELIQQIFGRDDTLKFDPENVDHVAAFGLYVDAVLALQQAAAVSTISPAYQAAEASLRSADEALIRTIRPPTNRILQARLTTTTPHESTVRNYVALRQALAEKHIAALEIPTGGAGRAVQEFTDEELKYIRERGENMPTVAMGAAGLIPDKRTWSMRLYDHISGRIQNAPPGTIRRWAVDKVGRAGYGAHWGLSPDLIRGLERVKGARRVGHLKAAEAIAAINAETRRMIAARNKARGPMSDERAKAIERLNWRKIEDALRGDSSPKSLTPEQRRAYDIYAGPIVQVTDWILANKWTWPHLQAFGLLNIEEVIAIKRKGPGVYLRRLYKPLEKGITARPAELRIKKWFGLYHEEPRNIGPRIRGGQFQPRRGDEDLYTIVDGTGPQLQYQQFTTREEAVAKLDKLQHSKEAQYGQQVYERIRLLDPFSVDELESKGMLRPERDVRKLISVSLTESLANMQTLQLFKLLSETVAVDANPDPFNETYVEIADNPAFGPLAGKWVPEPLAYAIYEQERVKTSLLARVFEAYNFSWKYSHVVLSPSTWARNLQSIVFFEALDGMSFITDAHHIYRALKEFRARGPTFWKLVGENEITTGWSAGEVKDLEDVFEAEMGDMPRTVQRWLMKHATKARKAGQAARQAKDVAQTIGNYYDLPDQVVKLASYLKKIDKGWGHEEALRGLWMYPNYDRPGRLARWSRKSPFGAPFVMFTEQSAKIALRALRDRPGRLMLMAAFPGLLDFFSRLILGIDDDEAKLLDNADPRRRWWVQRYFSPMLPWRGADGEPVYWNLLWVFPLASDLNIFKPSGGVEIPFIFGQPWFSASQEILFNRDNWSGKEIASPDDSVAARLWKWAAHALKTTAPLPPMVSRTGGGGITRLFRAARGESNESVERALLREVFGVRWDDPYIRRDMVYAMLKKELGAERFDEFSRLISLYNEAYRGDDDRPIRASNVTRSLRRDRAKDPDDE